MDSPEFEALWRLIGNRFWWFRDFVLYKGGNKAIKLTLNRAVPMANYERSLCVSQVAHLQIYAGGIFYP